MMTRRQLADSIDDLDGQIAELQREKSEFYTAYREQLEGHDKGTIKLEMAAVKAAIRHRQKLTKDRDAVEEKDDLVAEIVAEITRPGTPVALARTRAAHEESAPPTELPDIPAILDRRKPVEAA